MKIKKIIKLLAIFLTTFILTVIFHPKPLCSFTHRGGWGCSSFLPFLWLDELKYKGEVGFDISSLHLFIGEEARFDLLIASLISVLATLLFFIIYDYLILKRFGRNRLIFLLTLLVVWLISRTIVGYPYSLFDLDSNWRESSLWFRPIFGGYE